MTNATDLAMKVQRIFDTFMAGDRDAYLAMLHPDFRFTSPYDDAIDRDAFMERCWPNSNSMTGFDLQRVFADGDEAFVLYEVTTVTGDSFRNTEHFTFRNGLLWRVEVFFGDPPAGHGRWKSEDIRAAATVRGLVEARYRAVRDRDIDSTVANTDPHVEMFDVVGPLRHRGQTDLRARTEDWFGGFSGPIGVELRDLSVSADGDTAFAHSLNHYSGDLASGGNLDMWVRVTGCYRFRDGEWVLVHEHNSVPFDPATGRPSLDLEP